MSNMLHYTFEGEQVKEDDPRADYQVNPSDPDKDKTIESFKKLAPLTPPKSAPASTIENPNYGTDQTSGFHELTAPVAALSTKPLESPKKASSSDK